MINQTVSGKGKIIINSIEMKLVLISPGTFTMGSVFNIHYYPDDPTQQVTLTWSFHMGVYEVTQEQYRRVMGTNPSSFEGDQKPVENVSWDDAVAFCRQLSELPAERAAGRVYRLPTEAEWEYACRAGTTTEYSFGDDETQLHHFGLYNRYEIEDGSTSAVGRRKPNPWGLYDMHGNVSEWCADYYVDTLKGPMTNPRGPASSPKSYHPSYGADRVVRGGSWRTLAQACRSAARYTSASTSRSAFEGFRVALSFSAPLSGAPVEPSKSSPTLLDIDLVKNSVGMDLKRISSGRFLMNENSDAHEVILPKPFYMGICQVTQSQYEAVVGHNPSAFKAPDNPVDMVSGHDAVNFCLLLSALSAERAANRVYRLPTEAEWEYVCRAGTTTAYSFGNDESQFGEYAWFVRNSDGAAHSVATKLPNPWGLYDMHGNVYEWCKDKESLIWAIRGGCFYSPAKDSTSVFRFVDQPWHCSRVVGFRVVLSLYGSEDEQGK